MAEMNKIAKRWITGIIMGLIALACLLCGGIALLLLVAVIVAMGSNEYVQILKNKGFFPSLKVIIFADAVFACLSYFNRFDLVPLAFTLCSIIAFMWVLFKGKQPYIANVATTILGFVYGGWFPLHLLFLRGLNVTNTGYQGFLKLSVQNDGLGYVVMLFVTVLLTDTGAYIFGKKFGKHKLAQIISPNKTIEGSIGGAFLAIVGALIVGHFIHLIWYHSLIVGILATTFAQIGDLSESLIKRDAGVKDSGDSLPGHGGFLDRADSYVLTIPVLFYYFKYVVLSQQLWIDLFNFIKEFVHAIGL
jgi:phosphatidate cytidylyltransferase